MEFGSVPLAEALGAVLAHSLPVGSTRLRKGRVLNAADLRALRDAGHLSVTVASLGAQDMSEDAAALAIAQSLVPDPAVTGLIVQPVGTGRINILAAEAGLARIDAEKVHAVNTIDPAITVATVPEWHRMDPKGMVATVKIIPYGVETASVNSACAKGARAISLARRTLAKASLIETSVGESASKGFRVTKDRLARLGVDLSSHTVVAHTEEALAAALERVDGDLVLILTGSATSDGRDTAPSAVRRAGGEVLHFGMPVDPGNLLFLARLLGRTVIGLPGCAKSPALNGADWVMERVICGVPITGADIQHMGVGGLLKEIPTRPRPRTQSDW